MRGEGGSQNIQDAVRCNIKVLSQDTEYRPVHIQEKYIGECPVIIPNIPQQRGFFSAVSRKFYFRH